MDRKLIITFISVFVLVLGIGLFCTQTGVPTEDTPTEESTGSYIVQGQSLDAVATAVNSVHARVTRELRIIDAVATELNADQFDRLVALGGLKIVADHSGSATI